MKSRSVSVAAFYEELRDFPGDEFGTFVDHERAVEILLVVDAVLDLHTVAVEFARLGPVALHVDVDMDLDDLVGREESFLDALLERVGVDRLAEVVDVRDVLGFLGRGGQADLRGGGEVVEDLAPGRVGRGAAAVAFVDDDQVDRGHAGTCVSSGPSRRPPRKDDRAQPPTDSMASPPRSYCGRESKGIVYHHGWEFSIGWPAGS